MVYITDQILKMKLQKSSVARRRGWLGQRIWAWPRDAAGKNEKLSWGVACERGRGARGKKESSADSADEEEGLRCSLVASSLLLHCSCCHQEGGSFGKRKFRESFTEGEINVCTWLREIYSCSCLTVLPGPAWVLLSKTNKPLFPPLYFAML